MVIVLAWLGAARSLDSQFSPLAEKELEEEKLLKAKSKAPSVELAAVELKLKENDSLDESGKSSNLGRL